MTSQITISPSIPQRNRKILPIIARTLLRLSKWRVTGVVPDEPKIIVIGAPHSSMIDGYYVMLAVLSLDVKVKFLAAVWTFSRLPILDSLFPSSHNNPDVYGVRWPLGWLQGILMRRLGGIPVERSSAAGAVDKLVATINEMEKIVLMLAPEGGTEPSEKFKSGFYVLSSKLDLPILPIQFDYKNRRFNLLEPFYTTGNREKDMADIRQLFHGIEGKNHTFIA